MSEKLTKSQEKNKSISEALELLRGLEKNVPIEILSSACNRYHRLLLEKRKVLRKKGVLEKQLADIQEKLK